jgi:hypothetical protein
MTCESEANMIMARNGAISGEPELVDICLQRVSETGGYVSEGTKKEMMLDAYMNGIDARIATAELYVSKGEFSEVKECVNAAREYSQKIGAPFKEQDYMSLIAKGGRNKIENKLKDAKSLAVEGYEDYAERSIREAEEIAREIGYVVPEGRKNSIITEALANNAINNLKEADHYLRLRFMEFRIMDRHLKRAEEKAEKIGVVIPKYLTNNMRREKIADYINTEMKFLKRCLSPLSFNIPRDSKTSIEGSEELISKFNKYQKTYQELKLSRFYNPLKSVSDKADELDVCSKDTQRKVVNKIYELQTRSQKAGLERQVSSARKKLRSAINRLF